ncbi:hypothetical protein [Sphingobacterium puteale]|uniref:hypothetical protein n=1 Tax=Sphingobacterium puteale TaxID=2420510 RepID=UPI003D959B6D
MGKLNKLEKSIFERLATIYPTIKLHIPFLEVQSREVTGVGMYINLSYRKSIEKMLDLEIDNASLSTNETIEIEGLKYGFGYEVDVTDGKIKFIELVTYGEEWNVNVSDDFFFT